MLFEILTVLLQAALWCWFLGCIITYKIKSVLLVEGMGLKSAEFIMLVLYSAALLCFYIYDFGKWILFGVLILWAGVQFFCHWRYTIFGASRKKLNDYNKCFMNTVRLLPASEIRLIPDLYHIVLHAMIVINLILCALTD